MTVEMHYKHSKFRLRSASGIHTAKYVLVTMFINRLTIWVLYSRIPRPGIAVYIGTSVVYIISVTTNTGLLDD